MWKLHPPPAETSGWRSTFPKHGLSHLFFDETEFCTQMKLVAFYGKQLPPTDAP